jgi:hypothetical protein
VPFDNYLIIARVKVRKGVTSLIATDVEDLRFNTTGQGDPTPLNTVRAATGQTVAAAATDANTGALIFSTDEDRLYYKGVTGTKPVVNRIGLYTGVTGKGATGWWSVPDTGAGGGLVMWWDGPSAPFDRVGILSYQVRYTAPAGRSGWRSVHVYSDDIWRWEGLRYFQASETLTPDVATVNVFIPKNKSLKVQLRMQADAGWCAFDEWQSNGTMTVLPAE